MRIYLDTNIITKLANHPGLNRLIEDYAPYINLIYSEAHIDDLGRSNDPDKTRIDLATIRDLTHSQCVAKYMKDEHVTYQKRDPIEFYQTMQELSLTPANTENLDEEIAKIDFESLGIENPVPQLISALSGFKQTVLDNLTTEEYDYSQLFKNSGQTPTLESLLSDMLSLINGSPEAKAFYQHARGIMDKHVKDRKQLSNEKEPIEFLNDFLPNSVFGQSFDDFTEMSLKIGNTHLRAQGEKERFITRYSNLDLLGFRSDSKMSIQNINTDATHAYFAAHCDVFITQDKKLKAKAEVLYKEFGSQTMIFDVDEACSHIPVLIPLTDTDEELFSQLKSYSKLPIKDCYSDITDKSTTLVRFLDDFLLGFFDENTCHTYQDDSFINVYYKSTPTLSKWYYKREYELLTNKLFSIFGLDNYGNGEFLEWSVEFSEQGEWRGRYWGNRCAIILRHTEEFGITLLITNRA